MKNEYAEKLMAMIATSHLWHFYTKSYAQHMAFGTFYETLDGLADSYIESCIGVHGDIAPSGKAVVFSGVDVAPEVLREFKLHTKVMRDGHEEDGQNGLVAILEEIMSLVDQTLYRLEHLS